MKEVQWGKLEDAIDMVSKLKSIVVRDGARTSHRAEGRMYGRYGHINIGTYQVHMEFNPPQCPEQLFRHVWVEGVIQVLYDHDMLETVVQERNL